MNSDLLLYLSLKSFVLSRQVQKSDRINLDQTGPDRLVWVGLTRINSDQLKFQEIKRQSSFPCFFAILSSRRHFVLLVPDPCGSNYELVSSHKLL